MPKYKPLTDEEKCLKKDMRAALIEVKRLNIIVEELQEIVKEAYKETNH